MKFDTNCFSALIDLNEIASVFTVSGFTASLTSGISVGSAALGSTSNAFDLLLTTLVFLDF